MRVSLYNYRKMNAFLQKDVFFQIKKGMHLDNDSELFQFQSKLENDIGRNLRNEEVVCVTSGTIERTKASLFRRHYAIGVSNGTAALQLSLLALGIGRGDEVITVPNTYIGTLLSISNTGAKPVLVDILPDTMLIDPAKIEAKITRRTKAIMPVHLYGQMADMTKIMKIAKKYRLSVIDDAAHSPLATFEGFFPGEKSDAACYSFVPSKSLGAATNGGMIITKRKDLFKNIDALRNPISDNPLVLKGHRTPCYLDWIQAVFVKSKLKHLREWTERRRQIADLYYEGLSGLPILLPFTSEKANPVFCDFVIRTTKRDKLKRYLQTKGIETAIHYHPALHLSKTYKHLGYKKGSLPFAEEACSQVLSLPVNPFLSNEEVGYIIKKIKSFFR